MLVAASTAVLIFAGGMVTSTGSGLAVPDWPNTYGWFMWTFPVQHWVGGIFYEHTHRLIASTVGFLIVILAVWLWRAEPRRWVRRARLPRAGSGHHARAARRPDGPLLPAGSDLDRAREPGADRLLSDDHDRACHVAGLESAATPRPRCRSRRPHAAEDRARHDRRSSTCRS